MDRLTRKIEKSGWRGRGRNPSGYTTNHTIQEVVGKLAVYEDIGAPEQIAAWKEAERDSQKPLTLEELWKINGEAVFITTIGLVGSGRWELVYSDEAYIYFKTVCEDYKMTDMEIKNSYGKTWLAYRHKAVAFEDGRLEELYSLIGDINPTEIDSYL
ncbi:MAG: hypothetical protein RR444_13320, partial [Oscillospiraceae bacterium]